MFYPKDNGTGVRSYVDIDTGDITIVHDFPGCNNGSVMHIPGRKR